MTAAQKLRRARLLANDLAVSFRPLPEEMREVIRDECNEGEYCSCLPLAASLVLDGNPGGRWPKAKRRERK